MTTEEHEKRVLILKILKLMCKYQISFKELLLANGGDFLPDNLR